MTEARAAAEEASLTWKSSVTELKKTSKGKAALRDKAGHDEGEEKDEEDDQDGQGERSAGEGPSAKDRNKQRQRRRSPTPSEGDQPPKKRRGRPRKRPVAEQTPAPAPKRPRGRPRKDGQTTGAANNEVVIAPLKRSRGRPRHMVTASSPLPDQIELGQEQSADYDGDGDNVVPGDPSAQDLVDEVVMDADVEDAQVVPTVAPNEDEPDMRHQVLTHRSKRLQEEDSVAEPGGPRHRKRKVTCSTLPPVPYSLKLPETFISLGQDTILDAGAILERVGGQVICQSRQRRHSQMQFQKSNYIIENLENIEEIKLSQL